MSNDPKPLSKPWMATEMPYLQQYRQKTFEDGDKTGGYAKYSELQRPYLYDENVPPEYIWWEFIWPDIDFPDIPTVPDTPPSPCSISEDCVFAKIIGSGSMECGQCRMYSQFHQWIGCTIAPWWAAFGSWRLEGSPDDRCKITSSSPVMATVCCDSVAAAQTITLFYDGPLGCTDSLEIVVDCEECCSSLTLDGDAEVDAGEDWVGTISPACPGATCTVSSNSGCSPTCSVNGAGSEVTVGTTGMCGSITVTVTDQGDGCSANTDEFTFRITTGSWTMIDYESGGACLGPVGGPCFNNCSTYTDCDGTPATQGKYKLGGGGSCYYAAQFIVRGCPPSDEHPTYNCTHAFSGEPDPWGLCHTGDFPSTTCLGGGGGTDYCQCHIYYWQLCEWKCSC